jgi:predicted HAD superfamily Cof-like phosphohydrolase
MSTATVIYEDAGDEVKVGIDFGPEGGNEASGAHQMAMASVHALQKQHVTNYHRTANWLKACGKLPAAATASLQIGCDIEEQVEFLELLDLDDRGDQHLLQAAIYNLKVVANKLKKLETVACIADVHREHALDALCDREVTGNGVAYLLGFDKPSADAAVLDSNDAKLVDGKPVILEGGKIGKPEGWTAPDLKPFV